MCIFLSDRECHKSGHDWQTVCYHVPYIGELILIYPEVGIGTEYVLAKYFDIERFVIQKQRGLCRYCEEGFVRTDVVVSRGRPSRKYYHQQCANKLNIL